MKARKLSLLLAAAVLSLPLANSAVKADSDNVGLYLGPRASYYDTKIGTNWAPGVVVRLQGEILGLEASGDYRNTTNTSWPLQASLRGRLARDTMVYPYVFGGGDYIPIKGQSGIWGAHAGAGLEANLNRNWALDGSWRYHWLGNQNDATGVTFHDNGWQVAGALLFHF